MDKTDTSRVTSEWMDSLTLLFRACEPLTDPCDYTQQQREAEVDNIERHTFYCLHVKLALQDGVRPLSWDEWSEKEKSFKVEARAVKGKADQKEDDYCNKGNWVNRQEFGDELTAMFGGDYPTKTTRKEYRPEPPLGDDVRMTARYGRRDEDDPKVSQ